MVGNPHQWWTEKEQLNDFEKHVDRQVRLMLSQELGHSREAVVRSYIDELTNEH